jgi:hypothetical protein
MGPKFVILAASAVVVAWSLTPAAAGVIACTGDAVTVTETLSGTAGASCLTVSNGAGSCGAIYLLQVTDSTAAYNTPYVVGDLAANWSATAAGDTLTYENLGAGFLIAPGSSDSGFMFTDPPPSDIVTFIVDFQDFGREIGGTVTDGPSRSPGTDTWSWLAGLGGGSWWVPSVVAQTSQTVRARGSFARRRVTDKSRDI